MDIVAWLNSLSLPQYEQTFRDHAIDLAILPDLTETDLEKIGVLLGHRKIILKAIAALDAAAQPFAAEVTLQQGERAERRQLTVMFCDLVGSTALSTRLDPEDLRELMAIYYACVVEVVGAFGGFVAKYMGDGGLVYFGYPQAHEDDAERALRAGLALVDRIERLELSSGKLQIRVGIATGLVIVGDLIATGDSRERGIVGETPNVAARLQSLAEPNTVLISDNTRRLVGDLFEYRGLGAIEMKGLSGPVRVWQVLHTRELESRFEALRSASLSPLVGREDEIELLMRRWERAKDAEGQIVLLSGEPGIGKSRIAATISERLRGESHTRLRYFCSPHHCDSPLFPFIAHLEKAAGFAREDAPQAKIAKLEALLSQLGERRAEVAALYADLLGLAFEGCDPPLPSDPQRRRELVLKTMVHQLEEMAGQRPVLVVLEDAHWIDSTSLELLAIVLERVPRLPVLFLVTFRPEFQPPWVGQPHVTTLTLGRLGRRETAALVERIALGKALPAEILDQIVRRADGIPLFVEELTKTILESRLIREEDGHYRLDGPLAPFAIPSSLHASLMARLDRLASVKEIAQIGAALGRQFSYELLLAVGRRTQSELEAALQQLTDAGLVFRRGEMPDTYFIFKHALVQDAAYSTLLRGQRQELHRRIGKVLEERFPETAAMQPEILAHHYTQAGLIEVAIGYWRKAGELALRRSATAEAVQHLSRAIDLIRSLPATLERAQKELDLHLALGRMIRIVKGMAAPETLQIFSRARDLLNENATVAEHLNVLYGLWGVHFVRAEHVAACEVARRCLDLAARYQHDEASALGNYIMGGTLWATGAFAEARGHLERTVDLSATYRSKDNAPRFSHNNDITALSFLAWSLGPLGYPEQARRAASQAIARARSIGHVPLTAFALYFRTFFDTDFGAERGAVTSLADEAIAFCIEHGVTVYELWARVCQGVALTRSGDPQHGIEVMGCAMEAAEKIDAKLFRPLHLGQLAVAYGQVGQPQVGVGLLDEAVRTLETTDERLFEAELFRFRGELLLSLGQSGTAEAALKRALTVARLQQARIWELRAALSLARLWRDQGRRDQARDLLVPVYGWFTEGFDTPDLRDAKGVLGELG